MSQADGSTLAPSSTFGRVDEKGVVYLRLPDGSYRPVGEYAAGEAEQALAFYGRRYDELVTEIELTATRLANDRCTPSQAHATVARVRESLTNPGFVGDLALLVSRVGQLEVLINVKKVALAEQRKQLREEALATRERLATEAEELSSSEAWRATGDRYARIIEEWKAVPQFDRGREQALWQRLSAARTNFDKRRRAHYQKLDAEREAAVAKKEALIKEAENLASSRDWEATTRAYRQLMDRWKAIGRAGKSDDALWERFRAAQEGFFAARQTVFGERAEAEQEALKLKEKLLKDAEKLVPVTDPKSAKRELRIIQEKWEKAGRVPRGDLKRIEARMQAVEDAVRKTEQDRWKKSNPELKGRASDTVSAFQTKVDKLTRKLEEARQSGDDKSASRLESELTGAKALLEAAQRGLARLT